MMPADLGAERVRDLRAQRDELAATLAKVVPLRPPPSRLCSPDAIRRFQASLRDLFLSGDTALTKNDLRFLVSEVVITGNRVELVARASSAIELMASGTDEPRGVSPSPQVRPTVVEWLQLLDSNQRPGG